MNFRKVGEVAVRRHAALLELARKALRRGAPPEQRDLLEAIVANEQAWLRVASRVRFAR